MKKELLYDVLAQIDDDLLDLSKNESCDSIYKKDMVNNMSKKLSIKKVILPIAAMVACLAVFVTGLFAGGVFKQEPNIMETPQTSTQTQSTISKIAQGFVMIAYAKGDIIEQQPLKLGVETPIEYKLKSYDIRNKNEVEIESLKEQLHQENQLVKEQKDIFKIQAKTEYLDNILLQQIVKNAFVLDIKNPSTVKNIKMKTNTDYWYLNYLDIRETVDLEKQFPRGQELNIDGDTFAELMQALNANGTEMFYVNLEHDMNLCSTIDKNPDVDMSMFDDTITFTVEYKNGKIEQSNINISLKQDGILSVTLLK